LWEAFLLQMNDFDRFLELKLRQMLDPVVAAPPPARRRAKRSPKPILAVEPAPVAFEVLPIAVPVAVRVASATQL
jgi:hypothetical protein